MYRYTGELRVVFSGDIDKARRYIGLARKVAGSLSEYTSYNEIGTSQRIFSIPGDEGTIRVVDSNGLKTAYIDIPLKEEVVPYSDIYCYSNGVDRRLYSTLGYSRGSADAKFHNKGLVAVQNPDTTWAERGTGVYYHIGDGEGLLTYYSVSDTETVVAYTNNGGLTATLLFSLSGGAAGLTYSGKVTNIYNETYKRLHAIKENATGGLDQYIIRLDTGALVNSSTIYTPAVNYEIQWLGNTEYLGHNTLIMPLSLKYIPTNTYTLRFLYTTDGGANWSLYNHTFISSDYTSTEMSSSNIFEYGHMIVMDNNVVAYIVPATGFASLQCIISTDNGASWSYKTSIGTAAVDTYGNYGSYGCAIKRNGAVLIVQRNTFGLDFDVYRTYDNGMSWTLLDTFLSDKKYVGDPSLYKKETATGNNAIILHPRYENSEFNLNYSSDSGLTWVSGKTISTDAYPSLISWNGLPEYRQAIYTGTKDDPSPFNLVFPLLDTNGTF